MSRGRILLATVALLAIAAALAWALGWFQSGSTVTVILRCRDVEGGTISVSMVDESGHRSGEHAFDVQSSCAQGRVALNGYRSPHSLRIRLRTTSGQEAELVAARGENIQAERNGYFAVIMLSGSPAVLANDNL